MSLRVVLCSLALQCLLKHSRFAETFRCTKRVRRAAARLCSSDCTERAANLVAISIGCPPTLQTVHSCSGKCFAVSNVATSECLSVWSSHNEHDHPSQFAREYNCLLAVECLLKHLKVCGDVSMHKAS